MRLHLQLSIYVCLCMFIGVRPSICCLRLFICLRLLSIYLSVCVVSVSAYRIYLRLRATAFASIWPGLSVGRLICLTLRGRSVTTRHVYRVCGLSVCGQSICVRVCG